MKLSGPPERMKEGSIAAVIWLGYAVAVAIVLIMLLGITGLFFEIFTHGGLHSSSEALLEFIDRALLVLIAMELFRTVMAYITKKNEVLAVLEASLVAVAREIILIGKEAEPVEAVAVGVLLVLVFTTYIVAYKKLKGWETQLRLQ